MQPLLEPEFAFVFKCSCRLVAERLVRWPQLSVSVEQDFDDSGKEELLRVNVVITILFQITAPTFKSKVSNQFHSCKIV